MCELTSLPLHHQAYTRCSGLARRCAPALPCLAVFLGAGELPRRLIFSCVCAGMVPVAPAVGAVLVCAWRPWWQAVWFDVCVVSSLAVCAFDGFLLWIRIASACPTIASLCNKSPRE